MNGTYREPHFRNPGTWPTTPGQLATKLAPTRVPKRQFQHTIAVEKAHHTFPVRKGKLHDLFPEAVGR
ncbi:MAG: hypothetical protein M3Z08_02680 [Chloroflexota bacterium]|nr:hypothetical protein [Chloroflexota bacterium]